MTEKLFKLLDELTQIDVQNLQFEVRKLYGIRDWAMDHLGVDYKPGDDVYVTRDLFTHPEDRRRCYAECARAGALAKVHAIDYNLPHRYWYATITFDREWATSSPDDGKTQRYWHGPAGETPDGMVPPGKYDQEQYPHGRKHVFMVHVSYLARWQGEPRALDERESVAS